MRAPLLHSVCFLPRPDFFFFFFLFIDRFWRKPSDAFVGVSVFGRLPEQKKASLTRFTLSRLLLGSIFLLSFFFLGGEPRGSLCLCVVAQFLLVFVLKLNFVSVCVCVCAER